MPISRAVMAREGITAVLSGLRALPPGALSDQAHAEFIRQCLITYAWCVREEQLDTVVHAINSGAQVATLPKDLDNMRAVAHVEATKLLRELAIAAEFLVAPPPASPTLN